MTKKTLRDARAMGLLPRKIVFVAPNGTKIKRVCDMTPQELENIRKDAIKKALETMAIKSSSAGRARTQTRRLIEFAREHHFIITPVGYGYYVTGFDKFGCCPCASERKSCPCEEAEDEIILLGRCKCELFWRDYETYLAEKLKEE